MNFKKIIDKFGLNPIFYTVNLSTVILFVLIFFSISKQYELQIERHNADIQEHVKLAYNSIINGHEKVAHFLFQSSINRPEILKILASRNENNMEEVRTQLLEKLNPIYHNLTDKNLRQLHFHLPDNRSFLRFHRPKKWGDDLTNIRESVRRANEEKKLITGFEEGRIYNGYRFVFPINYRGEHLGTVETSMSYQAIIEELKKTLPFNFVFILDSNVVKKKVFADEQSNYTPCVFGPEFYLDINLRNKFQALD